MGTVPDLRTSQGEVVESGLSPKKCAYLSEIFSSIQGEGLLVGLRQIFVRFSGCTLTCDYCDTPESRVQSSEFRVQKGTVPDLRTERSGVVESGLSPSIYTIPNPVSSEKLTEIVNSFQTHPNLHHSISLTGGEPLEQIDFLKEWLPMIHRGMACHAPTKIYLETNGILSTHLSEIVDLIDIIGMDIKLPSVAGVKALGTVPDLRTPPLNPPLTKGGTKGGVESGLSPTIWDLHYDFLKIASPKEVFVKVVVSRNVADSDIERAIDIVSSINPDIPFIFQPKTPLDIDTGDLFRLQEIASRKLSEVRVIPQVHKLLNLK